MKHGTIMFFLLAAICMPVHSQSRNGSLSILLTSPEGSLTRVGINALGAGDAVVAEIGAASSALTNPAAMRLKAFSVSGEFGKYSTSDWMNDVDYNGHYLLPAFLSLGLPVGQMSLSAGYFKQFSHRLNIGPIPITTIEFPDGTGELFTAERRVDIHAFYAALSTPISDAVSVGLTLGLNYLKYDEDIFKVSYRGSKLGPMFIVGGLVELEEKLNVGASFRYNLPLEFSLDVYGGDIAVPVGGPNPTQVARLEVPMVQANLPPILNIGTSWQPIPELRLLGAMEFQNWRASSFRGAVNRWNIHAGAVIDPVEVMSLRIGMFTAFDPYENVNDLGSQTFVTCGIELTAEPILFSAAIADSHLFKKSQPANTSFLFRDPFYQTYVSAGASVVLK